VLVDRHPQARVDALLAQKLVESADPRAVRLHLGEEGEHHTRDVGGEEEVGDHRADHDDDRAEELPRRGAVRLALLVHSVHVPHGE